jgi:uncharacterized protein involved in exopolysaccharide biosynthesis
MRPIFRVALLIAPFLMVLFYLIAREPQYTVVAKAKAIDSPLSAALSGKAGGLTASLVGLVGAGNNDRVAISSILNSDAFKAQLIKSLDISQTIIAKIKSAPLSRAKALFTYPELGEPEVLMYFSENLYRASEDRMTGEISVSVVWNDPAVAARWANQAVMLVNEYERSKDLGRATARLEYLEQVVVHAETEVLRSAASKLIEIELQNVVGIRGEREYRLISYDPAIPPIEPNGPGAILVIILGALGTLGVAAALYRVEFRAWLQHF